MLFQSSTGKLATRLTLPAQGDSYANMVSIWQITVIYHHAIDQWFSARFLDLPPWGTEIILGGCGINRIINNYVNPLLI